MTMNYPIIPDIPTQAVIIHGIDLYLREVVQDEEVFERWPEEGCPDGCFTPEDIQCYLDLEGETFRTWIGLANEILNQDGEGE